MELRNTYIKPATIEITNKIIQQMSNCICKVKNNQSVGTGFFCTIPYKNNNKIHVLITSYQIINEFYIQNNSSINLLLGDYNEIKIINLDPSRNIYFSKDYNISIIELKNYDNINNYLELDNNLFRNDIKSIFENESIYILQYLNGGKALVSYGIIGILNGKFINHLCCVESGAIWAPILNLTNNGVIGISLGVGDNFNNFNVGILLKYAIEDFINKYQINNQLMPSLFNINFQGMEMNNNYNNFLIPNPMINNNDFNGNINQAELNQVSNNLRNINIPKKNINFKGAIEIFLSVDYGTKIEQLLQLYLKKINKEHLIGNNINICFIYNAQKINIKDKTAVEEYFKEYIPIILVTFHEGLCGGPSRKFIFKTTSGHIVEQEFGAYSTVKQLLESYLIKVNKQELIEDDSNKICFLYKGNIIKSMDKRHQVYVFFLDDFNPTIVVNDPNNLIGK